MVRGIFFIFFIAINLAKLQAMRSGFRTVYCILILLIDFNLCSAQDTTKPYPAAVLVQLRSEHNRMEALTKARMYEELEEVKKDALAVRDRMVLDFHNNFSYCPVYYYMDTNADLIKKKIFDGILLQEDGSPVKNPVVNSNSDNYVIAYYGYPVSQSTTDKVQADATDSQPLFGKGLVILNDKMLQLTYFYKFGYDEIFFDKRKQWIKKYYYNSKRFDIEYYPLAYLFNHTMLEKNGRRHMIVEPSEFK